jgi:predicted permease
VHEVDPGFDTDRTVAIFMSTSSSDIPVEGRRLFYDELAERFTALPWVRSATVAAQAPLSPHPSSAFRFAGGSEPGQATLVQVVPTYFETLGMGIVRGRGFAPGDTVGAPLVAVVNERLAERYVPGENPVGRSIWWPQDGSETELALEIVGVASNAKVVDLLAPQEPAVYLDYHQHYYKPGNAVAVAVTIDPQAAVPLLEQEIRAVDPRLAIVNTIPYREVVDGFTYPQRMNAELFSVVAFLGLVLAAAGLFGVLSLAVASRTREIGIRRAVGASGSHIVRAVIGRVVGAVVVGIAFGLAASVAAAPLVRGMLFDMEPGDPLARMAGVGVLLAAAALAVWFPVRKALDLDPMSSLRVE